MSWHHPTPPPGPGAPGPQHVPQHGPQHGGLPGPGVAPHRPAPAPALAVVALCTGIASIVLVALLGPLSAGLGVAGLVTGGIALSRRLPGRGMALAGVVTGAVGTVLAVVVTVVVFAVHGTVFLAALAGAAQSGGSASDGSATPDEGRSAGEHAFGQTAELDEYTVSVDGVSTRGDVVFADLTVRFTGRGSGDSYEDLYGYLYDAEGYEYDATDCTATLSPDAADLPDLEPGGTAAFQMCFEGVEDPHGVWVEVDDAAQGTYAGWTDPATLEGAGGGPVGV